jgi:hypothetical protein
LTYVASRYVAAFLLLTYGLAKLTGAQFTVLESELDKPLREVSGFWLTWYYFGYSPIYGTIVAVAQIAGAVALLGRRTALVGALLLLPLVGNIILINIFYAIDVGALLVAIVIGSCLVRIIAAHTDRLAQLLLSAAPPRTLTGRTVKALVCMAIVAVPLLWTYYIANYNNRLPTPIDGTWVVRSSKPADAEAPTHVYFERNRAYMCVFRYGTSSSTHHFEYDARHSRIAIWTSWLTKGPLLLKGQHRPGNETIELVGRLPGSAAPVTLQLRKLKSPSRAAG